MVRIVRLRMSQPALVQCVHGGLLPNRKECAVLPQRGRQQLEVAGHIFARAVQQQHELAAGQTLAARTIRTQSQVRARHQLAGRQQPYRPVEDHAWRPRGD